MAAYEELTLELALAWIYARDHQFVAAIDKSGYSPLAGAFAKFNDGRERRYFPAVTSVEESWRLLQERIIADQLVFRGVPFLRRAEKIFTLSDLGTNGVGPPREIPRDYSYGNPFC
jgi:hypothetical protein